MVSVAMQVRLINMHTVKVKNKRKGEKKFQERGKKNT